MIHPKIKKIPPIGVIIPIIGNSVNANKYRLPENNIMPNKKESAKFQQSNFRENMAKYARG